MGWPGRSGEEFDHGRVFGEEGWESGDDWGGERACVVEWVERCGCDDEGDGKNERGVKTAYK